jgi:hypothetical protein
MSRRQKSPAVLTVAIFHLILGGLGLLLGLCGVAMLAATGGNPMTGPTFDFGNPQVAQQQKAQQEAIQRVMANVPFIKPFQIGTQVVNLTLSAVLLVAGIGLLAMRSWARWLSVAYAGVSIPVTLATMVYMGVYLLPAQQEMFRQMPTVNAQQAQMMQSMGQVMGPMTLFFQAFYFVYPAVVLIILLMPSVGAVFSGKADRPRKRRRDEEEVEDYYDEPDDR